MHPYLPLLALLLHPTTATPPPLPHINLTITPSRTYQTIRGFGIGLSPSSPDALLSLSQPDQSDVFSLLFNTSKAPGAGAGFSILRLELDSSSTSPRNRSITWSGPHVWVAQETIRKFGLDLFYASAGTGDGDGEEDGWARAYGRYLARFVREYRERGIPAGWIGLADDTKMGNGHRALAAARETKEELDRIDLGEVGVGCCEDRD
ncbi:putative glucosylceramidase 1 [Madurella mycetomatis]|uniref:Glucosylceramidase 1 n=1 Tax=Madurella mycetomatis TaxID=100816 RepID=A0A175WA72_9PEZI|nr:putative glucosylceramidase 1 [Madurella mycetomatis]